MIPTDKCFIAIKINIFITSLKPRLQEQCLCGNFYVTSFICSCTWGHLLGFYVANTFAEKLVCQFLCGKQKLSVTSICSCIWLVTYLSHACIYLHVCQALCDYNIAFNTIFLRRIKNICCIIYTSNGICHGKLSNKNCSCKRGLKTHNLFFLQKTICNKSVHKLLKSCVRTACSKLLKQVWNKLLTTWNKLDGTIRLVTRFFQQDWYSHEITILLQAFLVNFVTILLTIFWHSCQACYT